MQVQSVNCNCCGAQLDLPPTANFATCGRCGVHLAIRGNSTARFTEQIAHAELPVPGVNVPIDTRQSSPIKHLLMFPGRYWLYEVPEVNSDELVPMRRIVMGILVGIVLACMVASLLIIGLELSVASPAFAISLLVAILAVGGWTYRTYRKAKRRGEVERVE